MEPGGAIPRIIHQTWKSEEIPDEWAAYVQSWKDRHPGWQYRLWTDEANRAFIQEHYSGFLATYDAYPYAIQRADAVRYCLLHYYGGVYIDMDIECLRPLDNLISGQDFVAVMEPEAQAAWLGRQSLISNAFMASRPRHPFLDAVLKALREETRAGITHRDVLVTTGPIMMSDVLDQYGGGDVSILSSHVAFPFAAASPELKAMQEKSDGYEALKQRAIDEGAYGVHYWANTWMGSLAGELINPPPYVVEGYDFVPGLDSPGNDIVNVGRDIKQSGISCNALAAAVAFNTDGFAKSQLLPRELWQSMGNGAANEGLYIKKTRRLWERLPPWVRRH